MSPHPKLDRLRRAAPVVLPSMLLCDFGDLRSEIGALEAAGAKALHLDVMDGHFVPNLTYGPVIVEAMRSLTSLPLDAHLMIADPQRYIDDFIRAGADSLTIHAEAVDDPRAVLSEIRSRGVAAGVAINPPTPVSTIAGCVGACDLVLVMSVMPGFGGQEFDPIALEKLREARSLFGSDVPLEVDGGVNQRTIAACAKAGADFFVAGSAIFHSSDYSQSLAELTGLAQSV